VTVNSEQPGEIARYVINGLVATAIHYTVLTINIEILQLSSAGIANFIAASFGITASFIGSRYFVFKKHHLPASEQAIKFIILYGSIAVIHGLMLSIWSDWLNFDYRVGFLIATGIQVILSYFGNKIMVFTE